jgi:hypothetical protein
MMLVGALVALSSFAPAANTATANDCCVPGAACCVPGNPCCN